jgi:hypothetical protein
MDSEVTRQEPLQNGPGSSFHPICRKDEEPQTERAPGLAGLGRNRDGVNQRDDKARHPVHRDEVVRFTDSVSGK